MLLVSFLLISADMALHAADLKLVDLVSQRAEKLEPTSKVLYKMVDGRELHLHVFNPEGVKPSDMRPCFVAFHGGGWRDGEPRQMYPFADFFAKLGMVGISVEYRLVTPKGTNTVFDCVKDSRSAMRYVRSHAKELGIDAQKIAVSGSSAGGHLAAATVLFEGIDAATDDLKVSSTPNAIVLYFPVIDTSAQGYGSKLIGASWPDISPLRHVRASLPPTILFHGTGDTVAPFKGAKMFHEEMLKAGNRCDFVVKEDGKHGYLLYDEMLLWDALFETKYFIKSLGW